MILFYQIILFFLGASIASFLNAWAIRIGHEQESIISPSRCRSCEKNLLWHQLIPIISWLIQLGRCGCQKRKKISVQYFCVELFLGLTFVAIFNYLGMTWNTLVWLSYISLLLFLFLTDAMYQLLYFPALLLGIGLGLGFSYYQGQFIPSVTGATLGFLIIFLTNLIFQKIRHKQGFGDGDSYLLAMLGAFSNAFLVLQCLIIASWIGMIYVGLYYLSHKKLIQKVAFGPFLILSILILQLNQILSFI